MTDILDAQVEISCPACASTIKVSMREVRDGRTVTCPQGHHVQLREQGNGIRQVERSLEEFERSLGRIGGNINLRIKL